MPVLTFQQQIDRVSYILNQGIVNRPKFGTVLTMTFSGSTITALTVQPSDGSGSHQGPCYMEIAGSLIAVDNYNSVDNSTNIPAWGNGVDGTPALTGFPASTKVTINPMFPRWHIGQMLIDGINQLYPYLYQVKTSIALTTNVVKERYVMPSDCEEILKVQIEGFGPVFPRSGVKRWSYDSVNEDGTQVLTIRGINVSGRPIRVWYRARGVLPTDPFDQSYTWTTSGLPASASDLPIWYAASSLIMSAEASRLESYNAEQSDRNRVIQGGTAAALSKRLQDMYDRRLKEESKKLTDQYPVRGHLYLNG